MRWSRRLRSVGATAAWLVLAAACSGETTATPDGPLPDPDSELCEQSTLSYQNFAAPFMITWCRGCHAAGQPMAMRQRAPLNVNFDTADEVRGAKDRILARATGAQPTMPPAGGPSEEERALLAEWLACGAK
jgi:uncharacterized membrane protein